MRTLLHEFLWASAARHPDKLMVIRGEKRATFEEIRRSAAGIATILKELGVRRGDRVLAALDNSIEMVALLFGVSAAGGVFVPVHPGIKSEKLAYLLGDCEPRVVVVGGEAARALAAVERSGASLPPVLDLDQAMRGAEAAPDHELIDNDLAAIIYTSGSTGEPKGVMLTHRNITNTAWAISSYLGNRPDDVVICVLPLSFDYGLYQVITAARVGFTVVLEKSFAYPWRIVELMAEHRVTGLPGVPTIFATLLQLAPFHSLDLGALRYLTNTAAPLPPAHIKRLLELFPAARVFSMYGLTECTRVSWLDPDRLSDKLGSVGRAMPNSEVYLVDEQGRRLPAGSTGELVVRGANVMRGYWRKPETTARWLRDGEIAGEKVLFTGDIFRMDQDGFLYFVGRRDDIFKCRGEKVSPKEIEHALCELDGIVEAAVVGVPHEVDGTAIKAVVVPRAGVSVSEEAIRLHCRARLESGLLPRFIEIRESLPRSVNGKVRKSELATTFTYST